MKYYYLLICCLIETSFRVSVLESCNGFKHTYEPNVPGHIIKKSSAIVSFPNASKSASAVHEETIRDLVKKKKKENVMVFSFLFD